MSNESRDERRAAARAQREAAERAVTQADQRKRRLMQLGGVLLGAAVIVVIAVLVAGGGGGKDTPAKQAGDQVAGQHDIVRRLSGIPQDGIELGKPSAPITVVEFGDLQCPACAAFSNQALGPIIDGYVRPGKVRWELRDIHFLGPDSVRLGRFAAAAGQQDKLYQVAELIWANQGQENSGYATDAFLRRIGSAVPGLDVAKAMTARDGAKVRQELAAATTLAGIKGVDSTPTFLVGRTDGTMKTVSTNGLLSELTRLAGPPAAGT